MSAQSILLAIDRNLPTAKSWYDDEEFTYPLLIIPRKEKRWVKRMVEGKEVEIEIEVEVMPDRKRLFLFPDPDEI